MPKGTSRMTSAKTLYKVKEVVARLHGPNYTESDLNRFYAMIKRREVRVRRLGSRIFIPLKEIERIESPDGADHGGT